MKHQKILTIACVVAIAAQMLMINKPILAKTTLPILLAQNNTSDGTNNSSTRSVNPENIRYSRRYAYRYEFECSAENQTVLVIYQARRDRQGKILASWEKVDKRPLIQWTKTGSLEFGEQYTPDVRCQAVSDRFNQHFLRGEGSAYLPPMSEGVFNGMAVVCAAKAGNCNSTNLLWTLRSNNRGTNGKIIMNLVSALKGNASAPLIIESNDNENVENSGNEWVEKLAVIDGLTASSVNQEKMLEVDIEKLIEQVIEEQKILENPD